MQQNSNNDELTRRILAFLTQNTNAAFTVQELIEDRYIYSSGPEIQKSLSILLRKGLIKVKNKGNVPGYQAIMLQKTKSGDFR